MIDPVTIAAAGVPLIIEAGKAAIQKWLAPDTFKPATIEDYTKLKSIDLEWFKTLISADSGGETYPWVEAIRKLQRPFVTVSVLFTWAYCHAANVPTDSIDNMAAAIGFYLFGDRTMFYVKQKVTK